MAMATRIKKGLAERLANTSAVRPLLEFLKNRGWEQRRYVQQKEWRSGEQRRDQDGEDQLGG